MIITPSYFQLKLSLPQRGDSIGEGELINFINRYEPEFLEKVLGLDLYDAFMTGLQELVIEDRWVKLLNGAKFNWKGITRKWIGFLPLSAGSTITVSSNNELNLTVGESGEYDPAPLSGSFILPPDFVNVPISIELRGTGTLKAGVEYEITSLAPNQVSLLNGFELNDGAVLTLKKGTGLTIGTDSTLKVSPIANYVYYQFVEDNNVVMDNLGAVLADKDNNARVSPQEKMIDAWNRMVDMNRDLLAYLTVNRNLYPEWNQYRAWPCHDEYWNHYDWRFYPDDVFKKKNVYDF